MGSRMRQKKMISLAIAGVITLVALASLTYRFRHELFMPAPQHKAFYFWKTKWQGSQELVTALESNGINRLYMRFFDVSWNREAKQAVPVSPIDFSSPVPHDGKLEVVPVVYITNSVMINIPRGEVRLLADRVFTKVKNMAQAQGVTINELQIDCDWTDTSRDNYFFFLSLMKRKLADEKAKISATLRLHQIKYADRTGVPPVNSGMLMFYNFGQIKADGKSNSIFSEKDASRYASYISKYELPLEISLPLFTWIIHTRDEKVHQLIEGIDPIEFERNAGFEKVSDTKFVAKDSFFFRGRYYMNGDVLIVEETNRSSAESAADMAVRNASAFKGYRTVALFDLDERTMRKYENSGIQKIFGKFE